MNEGIEECIKEIIHNKDIKLHSVCRMDNWKSDCEKLINQQINAELYASHVYRSLSSFFASDSQGYPGLSKFFKESSHEESEHAEKFIEYQNIRGGIVSIEGIDHPDISILIDSKSDTSIVYNAFQFALELEQSIYKKILHISNITNDPGLEDFLDDFIKEQIEGQYQLGIKIKQLEHIGKDGHGLWHFDQQLLKE